MAKKRAPSKPEPTPPSISPQKAIELMRWQVAKARELLANRPISSDAEQAWNATTRDVLTKAFGTGSHNVDAVMVIGVRFSFGGGSEVEWEQDRAQDFATRITVLEEMVGLLEAEHGSSPSIPAPPHGGPPASAVGHSPPVANSAEGKIVRAFISYSWDSDAHKDWVRGLADELIRNAVATMLDQYDLPAGGDRFRFMEANVRESDYVLCVCTPEYVKRANERQRGVGVETSLITPKFFDQNQNKTFIPIIRAANGGQYTPDYMSALIYVDFRDDAKFAASMEDLLRQMHKQPKYIKPALGPVPNFGAKTGSAEPSSAIAAYIGRVLASTKADWKYFDDKGLFVFNADARLVIQRRPTDSKHDRFNEGWAEKFPDPAAHRAPHEVRVNGTLIHEETLVCVDGGRMYLPMPDSPMSLTVPPDRDKLARLVNQFHPNGAEYDRYLKTAGLLVQA